MDEELLNEFIIEAIENLDCLDQELMELEENSQNKDLINSIFRRIHTIKGTCGFLELTKLESLTHNGETLLDSIRSEQLKMSENIISALLDMLDTVRRMLEFLEKEGTEIEADNSSLIMRLKELNNPTTKSDLEIEECLKVKQEDSKIVTLSKEEQELSELDALFNAAKDEYEKNNYNSTEEIIEKTEVSNEKNFTENSKLGTTIDNGKANKEKNHSLADSTLRIDIELIDKLMNLVGELVLTRNHILQFTSENEDKGFKNTTQQLNLITTSLQEEVMRTRMQSIANIWNKFPRIVRDISKTCKKEVQVIMEGEETELDRTIIAAIKDPLTHIIRNSVDHGIETPNIRETNGKSRCGTIFLTANHEGGNVIIEIRDDGAGINTERVKAKAFEKGLYTEEALSAMNEREILNLIFHAGFSTAEKLSNISGRGVGMDVVRSNLETIGGSIELQSKSMIGTTIRIKIPLTLAIIPALTVTQAGQCFAIPQTDLVELFRLEGDEIVNKMEDVRGSTFIRLRGELLPVLYLGHELELQPKLKNELKKNEDSTKENFNDAYITVVVVKVDSRHYGLVIDEVHETQEIVVKPLGTRLRNIEVFGGATIMGDGKVALILDTNAIARRAGVFDDQRIPLNKENLETNESEKKTALIVADISSNQRVAIELKHVNRLEEFSIKEVEYGSGHQVINYRNGLLRLINLADEFYSSSENRTGNLSNTSEELKVIVINSNNTQYGFVVENIVDIVEEHVELNTWDDCKGIRGSALLKGKVTDLIDLEHFGISEGAETDARK